LAGQPKRKGVTIVHDEVQKVIDKMKPALQDTEVVVLDVSGGTVTVQIFASGCHAGPPKEAAAMIIQEQLEEDVPDFERLIVE